MRTLCRVVLLFFVAITVAFPATAQSSKRDALTGIGPIRVVIEGISLPSVDQGRLSDTMLQTAVELRLRQNDVPVDDEVVPYLYVRVNAVTTGDGLYGYGIDVELKTIVQIEATGREAWATIWDMGSAATIGGNHLRDLRDTVLDHVDQFSNDYLAVNPR